MDQLESTELVRLERRVLGLSQAVRGTFGPNRPLTLFLSFAAADTDWLQLILPYLKILEKERNIEIFCSPMMDPGVDWEAVLFEKMEQAVAAVSLVSPAYACSPWCEVEFEYFCRRRDANELVFFPVQVEPIPLKILSEFSSRQLLPRFKQTFSDKTLAEISRGEVLRYLCDLVEDIAEAIDNLLPERDPDPDAPTPVANLRPARRRTTTAPVLIFKSRSSKEGRGHFVSYSSFLLEASEPWVYLEWVYLDALIDLVEAHRDTAGGGPRAPQLHPGTFSQRQEQSAGESKVRGQLGPTIRELHEGAWDVAVPEAILDPATFRAQASLSINPAIMTPRQRDWFVRRITREQLEGAREAAAPEAALRPDALLVLAPFSVSPATVTSRRDRLVHSIIRELLGGSREAAVRAAVLGPDVQSSAPFVVSPAMAPLRRRERFVRHITGELFESSWGAAVRAAVFGPDVLQVQALFSVNPAMALLRRDRFVRHIEVDYGPAVWLTLARLSAANPVMLRERDPFFPHISRGLRGDALTGLEFKVNFGPAVWRPLASFSAADSVMALLRERDRFARHLTRELLGGAWDAAVPEEDLGRVRRGWSGRPSGDTRVAEATPENTDFLAYQIDALKPERNCEQAANSLRSENAGNAVAAGQRWVITYDVSGRMEEASALIDDTEATAFNNNNLAAWLKLVDGDGDPADPDQSHFSLSGTEVFELWGDGGAHVFNDLIHAPRWSSEARCSFQGRPSACKDISTFELTIGRNTRSVTLDMLIGTTVSTTSEPEVGSTTPPGINMLACGSLQASSSGVASGRANSELVVPDALLSAARDLAGCISSTSNPTL